MWGAPTPSLQSAAQLSRSQLGVFASGSISVIPKPCPDNRAVNFIMWTYVSQSHL